MNLDCGNFPQKKNFNKQHSGELTPAAGTAQLYAFYCEKHSA